MLEDDEIWSQTDDVHNQEWNKLENDFTNAGYREGITAGKENSLQEGFDEGFATVGVPLGRDIGRLRGIASACINILASFGEAIDYPPLTELRDILRCLNQLRFKDLVPPDSRAEEHMKDHLQSEMDPFDAEKHNLAISSLKDCRVRLQKVIKQVGLQLSVS